MSSRTRMRDPRWRSRSSSAVTKCRAPTFLQVGGDTIPTPMREISRITTQRFRLHGWHAELARMAWSSAYTAPYGHGAVPVDSHWRRNDLPVLTAFAPQVCVHIGGR